MLSFLCLGVWDLSEEWFMLSFLCLGDWGLSEEWFMLSFLCFGDWGLSEEWFMLSFLCLGVWGLSEKWSMHSFLCCLRVWYLSFQMYDSCCHLCLGVWGLSEEWFMLLFLCKEFEVFQRDGVVSSIPRYELELRTPAKSGGWTQKSFCLLTLIGQLDDNRTVPKVQIDNSFVITCICNNVHVNVSVHWFHHLVCLYL
jgi:hypothetical protein